jgi:plastocyanin
LDQTQAVGGVISTHDLVVSTAGTYDVVLTDLAFPAAFADLAAVVSQGGTVVGKIYGGGTFPFPASPGTYQLTTVSTPGSDSYGLYSINVAPALPTVSFSSSASTVTSGGSVTLTWSSTNATSCTASGGTGWSGTEATSGTLSLTVSTNETLTLACTGAGGSASQTVSITATAAAHSGGGSIDAALLAGLGMLVAMRTMGQKRRAPY